MRIISSCAAEPLDDVAWDAFVAGWPDGHLLQTSRWGALKARFGWRVERIALLDGSAIAAGAQVLYRSLPFSLTLAYVPKGPLVDWSDDEAVDHLLVTLRQAVCRHRVFCLKLEPDRLEDPTQAAKLMRYGLRPSSQAVQPRSTILVDLDGDENEMLARVKPKTRYNIRLAERRGVIVREGTVSDLATFQKLVEETVRRDKFAAYSAEYYHVAYDLFVPNGYAKLLVATYQDVVLAGIMVFAVGCKAWYIYGASGNAYRNLMPNYLLQWKAIQWAKARGCTTYDLWGIPDEVGQDPEHHARTVPDRRDGLWGVYRFKQGFGGRVVRYLGAYDDVYRPLYYWLYNQAAALLKSRWGEAWHRRLRPG